MNACLLCGNAGILGAEINERPRSSSSRYSSSSDKNNNSLKSSSVGGVI